MKWLRVMERSDVKTACRLMDAKNHSRYPEHPSWSSAKNCRERWLHVDNTPVEWKPKRGVLGGWGDSHPRVLEVTVEGDKATVVVQGIGQGRPVWLVKERGRWLVDEVEYSI